MFRHVFAVLTLVVATTGAAFADADEASIHLQLPVGWASIVDPAEETRRVVAPVMGIGGRLAYAPTDRYTLEVGVAWERLGSGVEYALRYATRLWRSLAWLRFDAGVTARFGVGWVPTLHASIGVQRRRGKTWLNIDQATFREEPRSWVEPLVTVGAGLEHRFDAHWVLGASVRYRHAIPIMETRYSATVGEVHLSYYWYLMPMLSRLME